VENTFGKDWQGLFRISPGCGRSEWHGIFRKGSAPHGIWISFFLAISRWNCWKSRA